MGLEILVIFNLTISIIYMIMVSGLLSYAVSIGYIRNALMAYIISFCLSLIPVYNLKCVMQRDFWVLEKMESTDEED